MTMAICPPGIHAAMLDEFDARFGRDSELRRIQMQLPRWLIDLRRQKGGLRVNFTGSFVTDQIAPSDIDDAVPIDHRFPPDGDSELALNEGLPYLECQMCYQPDLDAMVYEVFGTDRRSVLRGVMEIIGWQ